MTPWCECGHPYYDHDGAGCIPCVDRCDHPAHTSESCLFCQWARDADV